MNQKNKSYTTLLIWIVALVVIGSMMGSLTKAELDTWYSTLNRSALTPPNHVFGIVWTILYSIIAISGWIIWNNKSFPRLMLIKTLYITQLILNWSWTPLFFRAHLTGTSLFCLIFMNVLVGIIIYLSHAKIRLVSLLMTPYLLWLLLAAYLNFYVWQYN